MENSKRQIFYLIAGALKAALLVAGVYILGIGLFLLMLCKLFGAI